MFERLKYFRTKNLFWNFKQPLNFKYIFRVVFLVRIMYIMFKFCPDENNNFSGIMLCKAIKENISGFIFMYKCSKNT